MQNKNTFCIHKRTIAQIRICPHCRFFLFQITDMRICVQLWYEYHPLTAISHEVHIAHKYSMMHFSFCGHKNFKNHVILSSQQLWRLFFEKKTVGIKNKQ